MTIFQPALAAMLGQGTAAFGPESFQDYLQRNSLPATNTWRAISIDSIERLPPDLRKAGVMVFRLGSPAGERTTSFALARHPSGWSDYFLCDASLMGNATPEVFIPSSSLRALYAFQLLPSLTESSLVNLALASGMLAEALALDGPTQAIVPATGQSTFTFEVTPHQGAGVVWQHVRGQVEIDALFVARRGGKEILFLVEAKSGQDSESLAKHKLVYPLLALRDHVPAYLPIVPVYMRAWRADDGLHFCITECQLAPPAGAAVAIADLRPVQTRRLVLAGF
jgi:hypothetical protein